MVKCMLKQIKNKKGVSLMISYVLLIAIVIGLSIGIYAWFRIIASDIKPAIDCKEGTSLIINNYTCNSSGISFELKNNGRFNINGFILSVGDDANRAPVNYLGPANVANIYPEKGYYNFSSVLEPNNIERANYLNRLWNGDAIGFDEIKVVQIQPFIISENTPVICKDKLFKQNLENCFIN